MSLETKAKNDGTLQSTESEPTSISRKVSDEKNTNNNNKNGKEKEKSTYSLFSRGKKQNIASIPFGIGKQLYIISSGVQSNKESKPKTVYAKIGNVDSIRRIWKATLEEGELEKLNLTKKEIERQEIMYETILTEADYLRDLKIIQDVFETPLREERIVLPEQANIIFMNLESLVKLHEDINKELSERQEAEHPLVSGIGDILSRYVRSFVVYNRFISGQSKSMNMIEELTTSNPRFREFIKECQSQPESRGMPVNSFMLLPFQRLLKYPLLLSNLLKATDPESESYKDVKKALSRFQERIGKIQSSKATADNLTKLEVLQSHFKGLDNFNLPKETRKLLAVGNKIIRTTVKSAFQTTNQRSGKSEQVKLSSPVNVCFWLFTDVLLITKPVEGSSFWDTNTALLSKNSQKSKYKGVNTLLVMDERSDLKIPVFEKFRIFVGPTVAIDAQKLEDDELSFKIEIMPYYAPPNHQPSMVYLKYGTKEQCNEWFGLFEAHLSSSNDDRFGMYSFVGGANDYKDEVGPAPKSQQASLIRQMESGGKDDWRLLKGIKYLSTRIERVTSPIQPLSSMASASPLSTRMLSLSPSSETLNSKRNSGDMDVTKNIQELDIKSPERPEKHVTPGLGEDSLSSPEKRHTRPKIASIERGKSGSNSHVGSPDSDTNVFALNLGLELDSIYGSVAHRGDTPVQELRTPDTLVDTSCELISQSKRTRVEENKQNHVENTRRDQVS